MTYGVCSGSCLTRILRNHSPEAMAWNQKNNWKGGYQNGRRFHNQYQGNYFYNSGRASFGPNNRNTPYRPKYQAFLNHRLSQSSLDLRDREGSVSRRNFRVFEEMRPYANGVGFNNRRNFVREHEFNNSNYKRQNTADLVNKPHNETGRNLRSSVSESGSPRYSREMPFKRSRNDTSEYNLENFAIQSVTFSSDSEVDDQNNKLPSESENKIDSSSTTPDIKKMKHSGKEFEASSSKGNLIKIKLPEYLQWGESEEEGDEVKTKNMSISYGDLVYTPDTLPKYNGKTPIGQEGRSVLQVHCCTFCGVVYGKSDLLQLHFLTRSHYNKYKQILNDGEVYHTIQQFSQASN